MSTIKMSLTGNGEKQQDGLGLISPWRPMDEVPKDGATILVTFLQGARRHYAPVSSIDPTTLPGGIPIEPDAWQPVYMSASELALVCKTCLGKRGASVAHADGTFGWQDCATCSGSGKRAA